MDDVAGNAVDEEVRRRLAEGLGTLGLDGDAVLTQRLLDFLTLMMQWNRAYNLTAVRDPESMVERHLLDSLAVAPHVPRGRIADIGTGAGLPGLPLAMALPDRHFTLVDSVGKKLRFVRHACRELSLRNVTAVQSRVEDLRPDSPFDAVIARALAPPSRLAELAVGLLRPGGSLLAMCGRHPGPLTRPTGFDTPEVRKVKVPKLAAERHLVVMQRSRKA